MGWYVGEPIVTFPDGTKQAWRMTTIWHRTAPRWKLVHMHASVKVPDGESAGRGSGRTPGALGNNASAGSDSAVDSKRAGPVPPSSCLAGQKGLT
ncbi:hypothetical protein [Arthrobacter sp. D1-17]